MTVSVRLARPSDADDILRLTAQLGYDVDAATLRDRLFRMLARPDQHVLIADADDQPAGWVHAAMWECIEADAFVVIGGLVVDANQRRRGIGRLLLERAEQWGRAQGCHVVRLWSSSVRTDAHRFYERLGYARLKTQYSFGKALDPAHVADLRQFVPRVET